ncbi:benzyl alcohol O-benzoyltransferase-like [Vicia villosa]|uniref:benzyl alcohol O-benzoyltransferase-like n=1 Tax=Vicia villosa TaxID=3911 RepID=UPI00273B844F|nr:benzyl alcohol O-benzoyltransferase-like [Vicia villosa]
MAQSLLFTVKRRAPELVIPSKPTPREIKLLSDLDDHDTLRFHIAGIQFYKYDPNMAGKDPVDVIRKALAKTLVFYYPFAGRLREGVGRKLMVDCTGEGVLFIEADADVSLKDFGDNLLPPFPCLDELLYDVPGSSDLLNAPLLLIQVTRLKCGGFILALRMNHTMSDAYGIVQFMNALAEISRGMNEPSISPVWCRELLSARDPPRVTCIHPEIEQEPGNNEAIIISLLDNMVQRTFFFGPAEVAKIHSLLPTNMIHKYTKFEIITAFAWRCRTIALHPDSDEEVRMISVVNARSTSFNLQLPNGYYGNVIVYSVAVTSARKLIENPLEYALNLIQKSKANVTKEYIHSLADLMVIKGRPSFSLKGLFAVSNVTHAGIKDVDFGWGKAVYGGPANDSSFPGIVSYYLPFKNGRGEKGLVLPLRLPAHAMERFVEELDSVLKNSINNPTKGDPTSPIIKSLL